MVRSTQKLTLASPFPKHGASHSYHGSQASSLHFQPSSRASRTGTVNSQHALLIRDDPGPYPWFAPNQSPASSDAALGDGRGENSWPLGVRTGLLLVALILVINATVTLWASIAFPISSGIGVIYEGTCAQVQRTGFGLHLLINVIGTLLLGASNFCMQCLTSPTRREIDRHHRIKSWLEVGILSVRNLRAIDRSRLWLWFFLAASSFPIHLMWVFRTEPSAKLTLKLAPGTIQPCLST